jgi:hypothetical protein
MARRRRVTPAGPITTRGRIALSAVMILMGIVLGFATALGLYQVTKRSVRESTTIGWLLCGSGQFVDDVESGNRGRRMICRNADGTEVSARNNLVAVKMALPFIVFYAGTGVLIAWTIGARRQV